MPKDVDQFVAENRRLIRDVSSRFVEIDSGRTRDLSFAASTLTASVSVRLFKRATGDQVIFDHPANERGFDRGTFGDDKGEWVEIPDAQDSGLLLQAGRTQLAKILDGATDAFETIEYGYSGVAAALDDDGLIDPSDVGPKMAVKSKPNATTSSLRVQYNTMEAVTADDESVDFEFVVDTQTETVFRVTASGTVPNTSEVRAVIDIEIEGKGVGEVVMPTVGETAVRDAVHTASDTVEVTEWAVGREGSLSKASTALSDEVGRITTGSDRDLNRMVYLAAVEGSDFPSADVPFDAGEVGLYTDDGDLIWATPLRTFEVDTETKFNLDTIVQVK